ncbi:ACR3 family arsenite efflux transporter [Pseudobacteriovorax antillogorgiicola]|uniref:Arsenite transporter, ACR3 family n=1 Tax=Pseudobacteriovorax antillogorgiicola TaxID=1513793 RepID=A0A1Y6BZC7_9BACT|nr:ACR3 family arsenite efflux transporter [Pseudobacteriovorax antillogorgiicola]TCS53097.1 ACR3 family arsenite transporter [Pseudobacteriovorax antillogorgiicola]SMF25913.1 arsenite transporter, ACR3 family [Pseudobacteriovorax antillogorgiicola]
MGIFERFLSVWVALAMAAGVVLGLVAPEVAALLSDLQVANVNMLVALLIWVMIYPMMIQIEFSSLKDIGKRPKGLCLTLIINWLIKPFTMALLANLFFTYIFADYVNPATAKEYIAGMILLGVAPCTAMVFVWSHLTRGDANYTLVQVSINDLIMVIAFTPIAGFLLDLQEIVVPWETLLLSVVLYVVAPLLAGVITRRALLRLGSEQLSKFISRLKPFSIMGLLATVVLLFAFQAGTIVAQPMVVVMIAIPLLIQSYGIFIIAYWGAYKWKIPHDVAAPAAMIGTSNFFELAVAVAISLFGLNSGAALATVVGVLIEVPVMLSLVAYANRTRSWFTPGDGLPLSGPTLGQGEQGSPKSI